MQAQYVGTLVRIVNVFTDSGVAADPTTVTFTLKIPGVDSPISYVYGVDPEVIKDATGYYRVDYVPATAGTYVLNWIGTGAVQATELDFFEVLAALTTTIRIPDYLSSADLDVRIGAAKVDQLFDDDGDGERDASAVNITLVDAEDFAASRMLKSWSREQIVQLAANDESFKGHVAWVACELASERRPEFLAEDGKGRYWAQYMRAKEHFDGLAKSKIASQGEATAGRNKQTGGKVLPTLTPTNAPRFIFAPDRNNPRGSGGF